MKLISWNVNGIRASVKKGLLDIIKNYNADVFCIQETKAQDDQVIEALTDLKGYHIYSNSATKKGYSGVAILSKDKPISVMPDMGVEVHDDEGRILCAEFKNFYLINVYVPNSGSGLKRLDYRQQWDNDFKKYLNNLNSIKPLIVTGDFNVAHRAIDLKNDKSNYNKTSGYTQVEIDGLDSILSIGLKDSFRELNPDVVKYSFWSMRFNARKNNAGWRIDYFLVSDKIMPDVDEALIDNSVFGSDHCPVGLTLSE